MKPTLVFLHGIGGGDKDQSWRRPLDQALTEVGHPDLKGTRVMAPQYSALLRASDNARVRAPKITTPKLGDAEGSCLRWKYERGQAGLEEMLGRGRSGVKLGAAEPLVELNVNFSPLFAQARRYLNSPDVRAAILQRVLSQLPASGDVVIVGHSLGSLIAIDLLDVLPEGLHVQRLITLGSPVGYPTMLRNRKILLDRFPFGKVDSWVNIWNDRDPVSLGRGVSHHFPEALDIKIATGFIGHWAGTFMRNQLVAKAIGNGLFGSLSREVTPVETSLAGHLDPLEILLVLRIAHGHYLVDATRDAKRSRIEAAFAIVQRQLVENLIDSYAKQEQGVPSALVALRDGDRPHGIARLSPEDSVIPLLLIAASNTLAPFEIDTSSSARKKALGDLSIFLGLTSSHGEKVFDAFETAQEEIKGSSEGSGRWILGAAGVALLVAGPIGWALVAPAGLAGGAAIVGGLAAFGPGGMVGGLLTAGALTSMGTGATVAALVGSQSSVAMVESTVAQLLATAIARRDLKLPVLDAVWFTLADLHVQITRELQHLKPYSDSSAPSVKALQGKQGAVKRALDCLVREGLVGIADLDQEVSEADMPELEAQIRLAELEVGESTGTAIE